MNIIDYQVGDTIIDKARRWYMSEGKVVKKYKTTLHVKFWQSGVLIYDQAHVRLLLEPKS